VLYLIDNEQGIEVHIAKKTMKVASDSKWAYRDSNSSTAERFVVLQTLLAMPGSFQPCEIIRSFPRRNILNRHNRKCIREGELSLVLPRHKKGKMIYQDISVPSKE